jgi:hypothetical protein
MAGRTEVPDSEDEPMTSSPVNILDGATNKLCAAAPVPLQGAQDAQDALHEAAQPHQANAENTANPHAERTDGLGEGQRNASLDVEPSTADRTDMQPEVATFEESRTPQAHSDQVSPFPPNSAPHVEAKPINTALHPDGVTTSTTSDTPQESGQTMTTEHVDTGTPATDMTSVASEISQSNEVEMKTQNQPQSATGANTLDHAEPSPDGMEPDATGPNNIEQKLEESERVPIDSFIGDDEKIKTKASIQSTKSGTLHDTVNTPEDRQKDNASTVEDLLLSTTEAPVVDGHHDTNNGAASSIAADGVSGSHVQSLNSGPVAEEAVCLKVYCLLSACLRLSRPPLTKARVQACMAGMELWMSR